MNLISVLILIALIIAAIFCSLAAKWYQYNPQPARWDLGWAGIAVYLWVQVALYAMAMAHH
jgi:hypothetical protein